MTTFALLVSEQVGGIYALRALWNRLGVGCAGVLAGVVRDRIAGEPWTSLGPAADAGEVLSRRQIGPAVLLERRLRPVTGNERAREITAGIVQAASIDFLRRNIPVLNRKRILGMTDAERSRYLDSIQRKFFNADASLTIRGDEALDLSITRCRFVELLDAIGERDMAPLFCEGDRVFFDRCQPEVELTRPETLACGGGKCDFRFQWK